MHSDSKNPGHFTLHLEILGFFHSVLHDADFLLIHVLVQQPSMGTLLVTLQLSPHTRCDTDMFMCYSKHGKSCTFDLTFSKKEVLCLLGNAISISYLAFCIEKDHIFHISVFININSTVSFCPYAFWDFASHEQNMHTLVWQESTYVVTIMSKMRTSALLKTISCRVIF